MAEKSGKKKTKKAAKSDAGVLGNLSATRPDRLGGHRRGAATQASSRRTASSRPVAASAAKTSAATKPAAAKPKAAPKKPKVRTAAGTAPKPPVAPPKGWQTPDEDGRKRGGPGGTEIVSTAVHAAGEIAQLGITVGGQLLKRAASRIPRP